MCIFNFRIWFDSILSFEMGQGKSYLCRHGVGISELFATRTQSIPGIKRKRRRGHKNQKDTKSMSWHNNHWEISVVYECVCVEAAVAGPINVCLFSGANEKYVLKLTETDDKSERTTSNSSTTHLSIQFQSSSLLTTSTNLLPPKIIPPS